MRRTGGVEDRRTGGREEDGRVTAAARVLLFAWDMQSSGRQDLGARTRGYSVRLLRYVRQLRASAAVPVRLLDQLAAAGTGIGANLSEAGTHALSRRQMTQCYTIALREAREAWYWLDVIGQLHDHDATEAAWLRQETHEFIAILTVSVRNLRFPSGS